jgi:predicted nucleic acid-binding protein
MPPRQPADPEVSVVRLLRGALLELQEVERILATVETDTHDIERAARLASIRKAILEVSKFVTPS